MLEIPEALTLSRQLNQVLPGKTIIRSVTNASPHKFAWFFGEPDDYASRLDGSVIGQSAALAGMVEIQAGAVRLLFADGVTLRWPTPGTKLPEKHQLLITFDDDSSLSASVQMYGGLWVYPAGQLDNPYAEGARNKPSPLSSAFDERYFNSLLETDGAKLSAKAFLATQQRIPGLGNGVLQDILYRAQISPRRKIAELEPGEFSCLFSALKETLHLMAEQGGRDTEKNLFAAPGGYQTLMSKKNVGKPCPACGETIRREAYLGGNVYYCPGCQH